VRAFAVMMPQLDAEERLDAITDYSVAVGAVEKHDRARHFRALERMARQRQRQRASKATPAMLAGMGIGVVSGASEPSETAIRAGANDG
tara:strand:+ start:4034 stop:4300 length:267 start_codon:yes stop_codon:yes gene_type:complete